LILAGTKASTFFLFLSASRCLPCESGEAWRAALRPFTKAPVLVPPGRPGLPNRDALAHAPPPKLAPAEHSEDRRARVEGPSEGRVPSSLATISRARAGCIRLMRACGRTFPSSAPSGHPLSPARSPPRRNRCEGFGPTQAFVPTTPREERRLPDDQDVFHRHDTRRTAFGNRGGMEIPPAFAPALSLTPPTLSPQGWGACFLMGIARSRCGHPRVP
jgi:hypothetical protein